MTTNDAERIRNELHKQTSRGADTKFVICPFGELGQFAKKVLNTEYNINEFLVLDNYKTEKEIKPVGWLKNNKLDDGAVVLLVAWDQDLKHELKAELFQMCVREEQIVDVMEDPSLMSEKYWTYRASLKGMDENRRIFHMMSHNVKFWLPFYNQDYIQSTIFLYDTYYEENLLVYMTQWFGSGVVGERIRGGTVLDIGANIGNHSLFYALECGAAKVIAFEPVKETYDILKRNVEINYMEDIIEIHNAGVGKKKSRATLKYPLWRANIGAATLKVDGEGDMEIVSIDELDLKQIDLMKIDVEGMERDVIEGALETIRKYRPYIILESWHDTRDAASSWHNNDNIFDIIGMLAPCGYTWKQLTSDDYLFYPMKQ